MQFDLKTFTPSISDSFTGISNGVSSWSTNAYRSVFGGTEVTSMEEIKNAPLVTENADEVWTIPISEDGSI